MTDAKKITKSAFATKNWIRNMKHLANITSNATDSEKAHAKAVVSFMMNTFIHIFEHIIEMAVAEKRTQIENVSGTPPPPNSKKEKGSVLVAYFVAFVYELICPAVEMQDEKLRSVSIDIDKLARSVGAIEDDETMLIGEPERNGHALSVPCLIRKVDADNGDIVDTQDILDIIDDKDIEEKFKQFLNDNKHMIHGADA